MTGDAPPPSVAVTTAVLFVPSAEAVERHGVPGGLSLLERLLKQVRKLGISETWLLVPEDCPAPLLTTGCRPFGVLRIPTTRGLIAALTIAVDRLPAEFLAISADRLVDPRVLGALVRRSTSTFASADGVGVEPVAWVRADDLRRLGSALTTRADRLPLATLDLYVPELRGEVTPYVLKAESAEERRNAWSVLLTHVQKQSLDLPGRYFDTPFENVLVRRLAPTTITPNQVTLLTLVVAGGVALLFLHGWLRLGVVLALVVGVLDGVDGKLARLKLATSKLGELEHVGDFFYENAWYLALAAHFHASQQTALFWYAGWALVLCDLADSLLYLVVRRRTGKMLDELTAFDRRFRAVAGRRNVYVMIFVGGFFSGQAAPAFAGAVLWAAVTVGVHGARAAQVLRMVPGATVRRG